MVMWMCVLCFAAHGTLYFYLRVTVLVVRCNKSNQSMVNCHFFSIEL